MLVFPNSTNKIAVFERVLQARVSPPVYFSRSLGFMNEPRDLLTVHLDSIYRCPISRLSKCVSIYK